MKNPVDAQDFIPSKETMQQLQKSTKYFVSLLDAKLKKHKISGSVFIGGSFAKGTVLKNSTYEIDLFVRCKLDEEMMHDKISKIINEIMKEEKVKIDQIQGSREYFKVYFGDTILFEIIPVAHITRLEQAKNITDLSYAHVAYVKKNIAKHPNIRKEIILAKAFCKAQGVYGAESYIQGFSGYAIECLVIHYKSLFKMAQAFVKEKEKLIIDPAKHYKTKQIITLSLNESKIQSPIVVVDPTWKERNVTAAVSEVVFKKFKIVLQRYLKNPSKSFFVEKSMDIDKIRKEATAKKNYFVHLFCSTEKQFGDIAGTKLKKFSEYIKENLSKRYNLVRYEFVYSGKDSADTYYVLKSKKLSPIRGPPLKLAKHATAFKRAHKKTFVQSGVLYAESNQNVDAKLFLDDFLKKYASTVEAMDISNARIM